MGSYLLGGKYLWLLLPRLEKGLMICAEELGPVEDPQVMKGRDHPIMVVPGLARVHALRAILLALEVVIAQDPILLPQDGRVTTPFLLKEGRILDHQGMLHQKEMVVMPVGHILQAVEMMQQLEMTRIMLIDLHMSLMELEHIGSHLLDVQ